MTTELLEMTTGYAARAFWHSGPAAWRDSAGGKGCRTARVHRRAHRRLKLLPQVSTWALMKALHHKKAFEGAC
jgi:hypothetical protein